MSVQTVSRNAVLLKVHVFWAVTPCRMVSSYQHSYGNETNTCT